MKCVIQRVSSAKVTVGSELTGSIEGGLFILVGVGREDTERDAELLVNKILKLRIFSDENGKMNLSVADTGGKILAVSNFTLYANYAHGNRPDYLCAAAPEEANRLYEYLISLIRGSGISCETGRFGADMRCDISLDGPVTIVMDSAVLRSKGK